jgi:hypothetical protein
MFVGHYSVAFAVKSERNRIPLWVLFVAVQFLDYVWATFVLLGIEKLRIVPGFTAGSPLDAYYMPYSHSLIAALGWSGVAVLIYKAVWDAKGSLLVGLAVFSHWILDFIAHPHDLAVAMLAAAIVFYLMRNVISAARRWSVITFGISLVVVQIGDTFVPRAPLTDKMTALGVWIFYTLFVGVAFLLEKRSELDSSKDRQGDGVRN